MLPLPVPEWQGRTNGDLADYLCDLEAVVERAQSDRARLREWARRVKED